MRPKQPYCPWCLKLERKYPNLKMQNGSYGYCAEHKSKSIRDRQWRAFRAGISEEEQRQLDQKALAEENRTYEEQIEAAQEYAEFEYQPLGPPQVQEEISQDWVSDEQLAALVSDQSPVDLPDS